jgi:hypothetical protein
MANAVTFKKVKVNHSGACGEFTYLAGKPVALPEDVLKALGSDSYEEIAGEEPTVVESSKEETKPSYKELQDKAKELGVPTNKKYEELVALIAEKEAEEAK